MLEEIRNGRKAEERDNFPASRRLRSYGRKQDKKTQEEKKRGGRKERREERRGEKYLTMISASETLMFKTSYGDQRPPSRGQVQPATCYRMACELGIVSMFSNG